MGMSVSLIILSFRIQMVEYLIAICQVKIFFTLCIVHPFLERKLLSDARFCQLNMMFRSSFSYKSCVFITACIVHQQKKETFEERKLLSDL